MTLTLTGGTVEFVALEFVLALDLSNGWHVDIEGPLALSVAGTTTVIVPAENDRLADLLDAVLGRTVVDSSVESDGGLRVQLSDGVVLTVGPDPDVEAWTAAGPAGEKFVCGPGGDVSWWPPVNL